MTSPIFVVGNPRSGTTMFRLILAVHSKINIPPESDLIAKLYPKYGPISSFKPEQLHEMMNDIMGKAAIINLEEQWQVSLSDFAEQIEQHAGKSYAQVCASLYRHYAQAKGAGEKEYWGDKNNAYGNYIDVLTTLYPEAKFVHIVRDGRAVLSSYQQLDIDKTQKYAPILPKDAVSIARGWVDMVGRIDRHLRKYAPGRYIVVRYEDILEDFDCSINSVCQFLEVGYESSMAQFHQANIKYKMEPKAYSWKENTRKPLDRSKASAWKQKINESDISQFEAIAGDKLQQYGYEVNMNVRTTQLFSLWNFKARLRENFRNVRNHLVRIRRLFSV